MESGRLKPASKGPPEFAQQRAKNQQRIKRPVLVGAYAGQTFPTLARGSSYRSACSTCFAPATGFRTILDDFYSSHGEVEVDFGEAISFKGHLPAEPRFRPALSG